MTDSPEPDPPLWLRPFLGAAASLRRADLSPLAPPAGAALRAAAVLMLLGEGSDGPDLLLIERASTLRRHAGQPAFPGGAVDPSDGTPARAALREAEEEVGLDPLTVRVLAELPAVWVPPSGFLVTPVLAHWRRPHPVGPVDAGEVAAVARVPIAEFVEPDNRLRVTHLSGFVGPAFRVRGLLVWGFTAGLVDRLLDRAGLARPWDVGRVEPLPAQAAELAARTAAGRPPVGLG